MADLFIENVDLDLLERQSKILNGLFDRLISDEYFESYKEAEALEGVLAMLDEWSDRRLEEEE